MCVRARACVRMSVCVKGPRLRGTRLASGFCSSLLWPSPRRGQPGAVKTHNKVKPPRTDFVRTLAFICNMSSSALEAQRRSFIILLEAARSLLILQHDIFTRLLMSHGEWTAIGYSRGHCELLSFLLLLREKDLFCQQGFSSEQKSPGTATTS